MNITNRTMPVTILTAVLNDASGNFSAVAGVTGKKILIWGILFTAPTGHTITFKSAATALTGPMATTGLLQDLPANASPAGAYPRFETAVGEAFNIVGDSAMQVSGIVYYSTE